MIATLSTPYSYKATLEAAHKVTWRIEDIIGGDKHLDFTKPFMPEFLAGVQSISCLNQAEKLILNQIRGNSYLYLFGVTEEFIIPLVLQHVQSIGMEDIIATQAFLCFAEEEGKHINLFRRFEQEFKAGFNSLCGVIGPAQAIADAVLKHHPLGIALAILQIEWMTQHHYLDSVQDNQDLDPQFCSLLKHHWLEEAQHAKLDALMVEAMVQKLDDAEIQKGIEDYFAIGAFLEGGLMMQVQLDIESLQTAINRTFTEAEKQEIQEAQEKAYRWTFLGSGMTHPNFLRVLGQLSESAVIQVCEMVNSMR
jgi:hypothetical protein